MRKGDGMASKHITFMLIICLSINLFSVDSKRLVAETKSEEENLTNAGYRELINSKSKVYKIEITSPEIIDKSRESSQMEAMNKEVSKPCGRGGEVLEATPTNWLLVSLGALESLTFFGTIYVNGWGHAFFDAVNPEKPFAVIGLTSAFLLLSVINSFIFVSIEFYEFGKAENVEWNPFLMLGKRKPSTYFKNYIIQSCVGQLGSIMLVLAPISFAFFWLFFLNMLLMI